MDLPARGIEMSIADTGVLSARIGDAVDGAIRIDREVEQDLGRFSLLAADHRVTSLSGDRERNCALLRAADVEHAVADVAVQFEHHFAL